MLLMEGKRSKDMQLGNGKLNLGAKKIPAWKISVWEHVSREAVKSSQLRYVRLESLSKVLKHMLEETLMKEIW